MARILLIEDEPESRRVLAQLLEHHRFEVIEAENGRQGIRKYLAHPIDLVICDLTLPGISGAAFCRQVAERHPALAPRLVLTSGDAAAAAREVQRAALACPVLGKPFSLADLERVVASIARDG